MASKSKSKAKKPANEAPQASVEETLERLTSAERRLKAQEWVAGFDDLLAAWRGFRASELAELIDTLSQRAARDKKVANKSDTQIEHVAKWTKMFHERSALGLGVLLADLQQVIVEQAQPRFIVPRIEALATVHDDPRIPSTLIPTFKHFGFGGQWSKVILRCQRAFAAAADPRTLLMLQAARPERSRGTFDGLSSKVEDVKPPTFLSELYAIRESIEKIIQQIPDSLVIETPAREKPTGADPAALLEQVRQSPDDDELRLVLADALDAAGDPRGELIVLQIRRAQGESNAKTWARERQLLKAHMKTWLGAIAPVVKLKDAVFERGFLEKCTAVARRQVDAKVHFQHEEWATVRSITFENEARITPVMRSLREAIHVDGTALEQLVENGHPKLERLGLTTWRGGHEVLAACPKEKLPSLAHLQITGYISSLTQLDWIWEASWAKQLKTFTVTTRAISAYADVLLAQANLMEVRIDSQAGYEVTYLRVPENPTRLIFKVRLGEFSPYGKTALAQDLREVASKSASFDEIVVEAGSKKSFDAEYEKVIRDWLLLFKRPIQITVPFDLVTPP